MRTRDEVYIRRGGTHRRDLNLPDDWHSGATIKRVEVDGVPVGWSDVVLSVLEPQVVPDPAQLYKHIPGTTRMTAKAAALLLGDKASEGISGVHQHNGEVAFYRKNGDRVTLTDLANEETMVEMDDSLSDENWGGADYAIDEEDVMSDGDSESVTRL